MEENKKTTSATTEVDNQKIRPYELRINVVCGDVQQANVVVDKIINHLKPLHVPEVKVTIQL